MEKEFETKEYAVSNFKIKVSEAYGLLEKIGSYDQDLRWSLYEELLVSPPHQWHQMGLGVEKSQFFHAFIGSTTDWASSPDLDLPGGIISKHVEEIVLPKLKDTLNQLKNPA